MDLDFSIQVKILEQVSFMELLSLSKINRRFFSIVEEIMRNKFSRKLLVVDCSFDAEIKQHPDDYNCELEDRIQFKHLSLMSVVLPRFGHVVKSLMIVDDWVGLRWIGESKKVFDLVNVHLTNLTHLRVFSHRSIAFYRFQKPFSKVEYLRLEGAFLKMDNDNLTFNEIFPQLNFLSLLAITETNATVFRRRIPHLQSLEINNINVHQANSIKQLIRTNAHVRTLQVEYVDAELLKCVADAMSQLDSLELINFDEGNVTAPVLHFERLKSLKIRSSHHSLPSNAVFRDLEFFEVDNSAPECNRWLQLVEDQSNLKRLRVFRPLNNDEIERIANLTLVEIMFQCKRNVELESIIRLIADMNTLKLVVVINNWDDQVRQSVFEKLLNHFEPEWKVANINNNHGVILDKY